MAEPSREEIIEIIKSLFGACSIGDVENAKKIISGIQDPEVKNTVLTNWNKDGDTALHLAVRANSEELARFLIAEGAPVDATNNEYETVWMIACHNKDLSIPMIQLLLDHDADGQNGLDTFKHSLLRKPKKDQHDSIVLQILDSKRGKRTQKSFTSKAFLGYGDIAPVHSGGKLRTRIPGYSRRR